MIWGFPDVETVQSGPCCNVQQHVSCRTCGCMCQKWTWHFMCGFRVRARVFKFALMSVKCLSRAGAPLLHWQIITAIHWCSFMSVFIPLCSSQRCHKRPESVWNIRVERAPGGDRCPSPFTVPQLVGAVDGQALQVVSSTSSSSSRGCSSSFTLTELRICQQRGKG